MFTASADLYDVIYRSLKDYADEAGHIAALLRARRPGCRTVLDVACGTGEHALYLGRLGFAVDGLDLDPNLLAVAARKNPGRAFAHGDMCDFSLGRRYDAVLCLFSSIGYALTPDRVAAALVRFREHLAPGGIVMVEPWFEPGVMDPARRDTQTVAIEGGTVTRRSRLELSPTVSRLTFDYEIVRGGGTTTATEVHELGLFTRAQMDAAFRGAGLAADYDPVGLMGRGLYVGAPASRAIA